ncbi:MAG: hypothetical protein II336_17895 [Loktanella sp.]|nr:hypothetical protein [Loktanella sp.]
MPAPIDQRLEKMLRASEAAGKVVLSARIDGSTIELKFGEAKRDDMTATETQPIDLVTWGRR